MRSYCIYSGFQILFRFHYSLINSFRLKGSYFLLDVLIVMTKIYLYLKLKPRSIR